MVWERLSKLRIKASSYILAENLLEFQCLCLILSFSSLSVSRGLIALGGLNYNAGSSIKPLLMILFLVSTYVYLVGLDV